jgi:hypothetical protein
MCKDSAGYLAFEVLDWLNKAKCLGQSHKSTPEIFASGL